MIKGQVISGSSGRILIRQKQGSVLEIGELLVSEQENLKIILQVFSLFHGSQVSPQNLELISGLKLEENNDLEFIDPSLRNYTLAWAKPILALENGQSKICKILPAFFSPVREITKKDLDFLVQPENPLIIGKLRSGTKTLDFDIALPGDKVFSHHIFIQGTTGRGKSVLLKDILWNSIDKDYCGILILDPHDEYYGRNSAGLKDHEKKENVVYYTPRNPPPGCKSLKINLRVLKPHHFNGVIEFSDPQKQALMMYYKEFGQKWIENIVMDRKLESASFKEDTLVVVRRQVLNLLDLEFRQNQLFCSGVFDLQAGETTIKDICSELEKSKKVIIDTSTFTGATELLIGSIIANEIFSAYKYYKSRGILEQKPVISIVLEEAPRVLGKDVLERGTNIFEAIAREGRKFQIGLTAITQLPSLIPRQILANMNTKIIMGTEMKPERQAIIESASQDLSDDDANIASLDKGEAIISSSLVKFPIPVKMPLFETLVKESKPSSKTGFFGIK